MYVELTYYQGPTQTTVPWKIKKNLLKKHGTDTPDSKRKVKLNRHDYINVINEVMQCEHFDSKVSYS